MEPFIFAHNVNWFCFVCLNKGWFFKSVHKYSLVHIHCLKYIFAVNFVEIGFVVFDAWDYCSRTYKNFLKTTFLVSGKLKIRVCTIIIIFVYCTFVYGKKVKHYLQKRLLTKSFTIKSLVKSSFSFWCEWRAKPLCFVHSYGHYIIPVERWFLRLC